MTAVFKHELRSYFHSLTAYVFGAFLLAFIGIGAMLYNLQAAVSNFEYVLSFASLVFVVIVPVLTMRVLAEERRQKTDQLLYSLPITTVQIIAGKYLALLVLYLIPLAIIAVYPLIFAQFGDVYLLTSYGSILAFFLLGCVFIAIGMFLSSLTESPVIAAITTCAALFFFYLLDNLLQYFPSSAISNLVIWIIIFALIGLLIYHITKNQMIAGIVTGIGCIAGIVVYFVKKTLLESLFSTLLGHLVLTDIFYNFSQNYIFDLGGLLTYLSLIILLVFLTVQTFEKRRWS